MFPSRWCCRQLFVIPALLASLWSRGATTVLKDCGGRVCEPAALLPGSLWSEAVGTCPLLQSGGKCQEASAACTPCPTPGHPDDSTPTYHISRGCGPVPGPRILRPLRLPIRAPWDVPVCRSQAASVLSRGTFVGLLVVEGGIQNGFCLP